MSMPRVLVLNSQSIYKNNATGITLRSFLSLLPSDKILEVYRYRSMDLADVNYGFKSLQIPPQSMPLNYYLRKIMHLENYYDREGQAGQTAYGDNIRLSWKAILKIVVKALFESSYILAPRCLLSQVDEFAPEVIYTMGASFYIHKWAILLSKRYKCPVVFHFMDNWRQTIYTQDSRLMWLNRKLERQVKLLESNMLSGLTISQHMANAYHKMYHHNYLPLMNTVMDISVSNIPHTELIIVYGGGLHLNRHVQLVSVQQAIKKYNITADTKARLHIYTSDANRNNYHSLFDECITTFYPFVSHDRINEVYEDADILLHIESFDPKIIEFTKYSISTKIPEYMASGKPIICFAPTGIASYEYINQCKSGICVKDDEEVVNALRILLNPNIRREMGIQGRKAVRTFHSPDVMLKTLEEAFNYKNTIIR